MLPYSISYKVIKATSIKPTLVVKATRELPNLIMDYHDSHRFFPQSLHVLLRRWCSQRPQPLPQILHLSSAASARSSRSCCNLYMYSSPAGARRCCCCRSLYSCSSAIGARKGRCRHSLCICSSPAGARRGCFHHSLYTCSAPSGARISRCRHSLCTCSSTAGARKGCVAFLYTMWVGVPSFPTSCPWPSPPPFLVSPCPSPLHCPPWISKGLSSY